VNRFDRVTSLLLLLQTRSVVTAKFLADHFSVTERTVYRDIRTLENAGVPIGAEAGVGYFLEKGYRLPPVSFTLDEAASLLLGAKLLGSSLDQHSFEDYSAALNKVRAVLDASDKDYLSSLDGDIEVLNVPGVAETEPSQLSAHNDLWLRECRSVLVRRQVVDMTYAAATTQAETQRIIEPIGLFYYSFHWHLIAWCRLREGYRDFRLDRIKSFSPLYEQFPRHVHPSLQEYLALQRQKNDLYEFELLFEHEIIRFIGEQRYLYGFVRETTVDEGVKMTFLSNSPEFMARWLLHYTNGVSILKGDSLKQELQRLTRELVEHWQV